MKIISIWIFILVTVVFLVSPKMLSAAEETINCSNRYVTLVNPVRGRDLWIERSVKPLKNQYEAAKKYNFPITWLLQYDVLEDKEVLEEIRGFDLSNELGVFLEVSPRFAEKARVIYPHSVPWFSPKAVFLSAYSQSERRKLIDKLFKEFKLRFGYYPKSVGAWWIDSYSLQFMKDKYDIKSALIVSDQKTTDSYGVWGQWWGVPYYPAKANILVPASHLNNKLDVVIIQWAQRHPLLAFGEGYKSSYSLQANDYTLLNQGISFFKELVNIYLDCENALGQITIGMETGMEGERFMQQNREQLEYLSQLKGLKPVTLSVFAGNFAKVYPDFPKSNKIKSEDSVWDLTTNKRSNAKFSEIITYDPEVAFSDYFLADRTNFLSRYLPVNKVSENKTKPFWYLPVILLGFFFYFRNFNKKIILTLLFTGLTFWIAAFGLILKSELLYGWRVYYGPVITDLDVVKPALLFISVLFFFSAFFLRKKFFNNNPLNAFLICLTFGFDWLIQLPKFTYLSGKYFLGFMFDQLRFVGISFSQSSGFGFINNDLLPYQANSLLKIDFNKVWDNLWLSIILYPLSHILIGIIFIYLFWRLPFILRRITLILMTGLFIFYLLSIFMADPRIAL